MRLINCGTLQFEEFYNPESIRYAILSHRWEDDEVTYGEMIGDRGLLEERNGFQKIQSCCIKALEQKMTHVWVDTCCINKDSSAELTEAINSMWTWYRQSEVCHTYLHDFQFRGNEIVVRGSGDQLREALVHCSWFYRGWTLQELLGPRTVFFYDCDWKFIDNKLNLAPVLSSITGIPESVLVGETDVHTLPVAQRMSWAANRECTRIEDTAYSLMGLFDVSMPMLYGEGPKAFYRLQQEIIKQTYDHTIFLWQISKDSSSSLLAPHPSMFRGSWKYRLRPKGRRSFATTNNGLAIYMVMQPWLPEIYIGLLDCEICSTSNLDNWSRPGIFLTLNKDTDLYERVLIRGEALGFIHDGIPSRYTHYQRIMNINIDLSSLNVQNRDGPYYGFQIRTLNLATTTRDTADVILNKSNVSTKKPWRSINQVMELPPGYAGNVTVIRFPFQVSKLVQAIKLGLDFDFQPVCILKITLQDRVWQELSQLPSPVQGFSSGNDAAIASDVSRKQFDSINCMEDTGWNYLGLNAQTATVCLKPPKIPRTTARGRHFECWQSRVKIPDYRGRSWDVVVTFIRDNFDATTRSEYDFDKTPRLVWKFDILCQKS